MTRPTDLTRYKKFQQRFKAVKMEVAPYIAIKMNDATTSKRRGLAPLGVALMGAEEVGVT
jgi:hypothetical protein